MRRSRLWSSAAAITLVSTTLLACGGDDGGGGGGDAAAGEQVWVDAGCGNCHTLAAAGSQGSVGPNLDEVKPDAATVAEKVRSGGGGMPAFEGELSDQEIDDVAAYTAESAE